MAQTFFYLSFGVEEANRLLDREGFSRPSASGRGTGPPLEGYRKLGSDIEARVTRLSPVLMQEHHARSRIEISYRADGDEAAKYATLVQNLLSEATAVTDAYGQPLASDN